MVKILKVVFLCFLFYSFGFSNSDKYYLATKPNKTTSEKPDFRSMSDVSKKKSSFIKYILNAIDDANTEVCAERKNILNLNKTFKDNGKLSSKQMKRLKKYTKLYKISTADTKVALNDLIFRVNTLPKSLVIAQAILESGWGTSRFAVDYNNYFGLHCFEENCRVKANGADVYMETFNNAGDSVLGYYHRLNTIQSFAQLRHVREEYNGKKGQNSKIIDALEDYSALEENEYQDRLNSVIKYNNLEQYDTTLC